MDQEAHLAKSKAIAETLKATKAKRKTQICKVREMKVIKNKLSKEQAEHLRLLFLEAKWFYNYMLANPSLRNDIGAKLKVVSVKLPDGTFEQRELKHLSGQMKQSIASNINQSIKTLAKLKAKGVQQPGALKFKSQLTTIELKQYGGTHRINRELNQIFIQCLKTGLKVKGLEQLDELEAIYGSVDIASAQIMDRPDGIFFKIVCYVIDNKEREQECVGIDMGLGKHITMSNNLSFRFRVDETQSPIIKMRDSKIELGRDDVFDMRSDAEVNASNISSNGSFNLFAPAEAKVNMRNSIFNNADMSFVGTSKVNIADTEIKGKLEALSLSNIEGSVLSSVNLCDITSVENSFLEDFSTASAPFSRIRDYNSNSKEEPKNDLDSIMTTRDFKAL